jgi:CheY-like chemotaxis protein
MEVTMRVLVVDDQPRARQSLIALLGVWHRLDEVREAGSGTEAVQFVEESRPDVIMMDVRMPGMNGLEATRLIKTRWPRVKIIVLSLYPDYQPEALSAGADAFVTKSDSPDKLRETLAAVIKKSDKEAPTC